MKAFDAATFLEGLFADPATAEPLPDPAPTISPDDLPPEWRERYEERAAIRHFDGGQALEHAEAEALAETLAAMRRAGDGL